MITRTRISGPSPPLGHREQLGAVLDRCGPLLCQALAPLLVSTLQRIDEVLYQLADQAASDRHCAGCFHLQRELRGCGDALQRHVLRNLQMTLDLFRDAGHTIGLNTPVVSCGDELALGVAVDADESQALACLIAQAQSRYRVELGALVSALVPLVGREDLSIGDLPMGPASLCQAFADALRALTDCGPVPRLACYRVFDEQVMNHLRDLYTGCLAEVRGVAVCQATLPVALEPPSVAHSPLRGDAARALPSHPTPQPESASGDRPYGGERNDRGNGSTRSDLGPLMPRQRRDPADTMDLVVLLFEQILAGPELPHPIKVQVGQLQVPYVKQALVDPDWCDDPAHPARRLLDRIGEASRGWNDDDARGEGTFHERIRRVIERVVTAADGGRALFAVLDDELRLAMCADNADAQAAEARVVRQRVEQRRRELARAEAAAVVEARLDGRARLPVSVAELIEHGIAPALTDAYLRDGHSGTAWHDGLALLDGLLWSIRPKRDTAERRALLRRIPELLRSLRVTLAEVVTDQLLITRWLKELEIIHGAVLRGSGWGQVRTRAPSVTPAAWTSADGRREACIPPIGAWLLIRRNGGDAVRAKLAWRSDDGEALLLVDRNGQALHDLSVDAFCSLHEQGLLTRLGEPAMPLVSRALEAVRRARMRD